MRGALRFFAWLAPLLLLAPAPTGAEGAARRVARVAVEGDGFVRLEAADLRGLDIEAGRHVEVRRAGRRVPSFETPEGEVVFLAHETATEASRVARFELFEREGAVPLRIAPRLSRAGAGAEASLLASQVRLQEDRHHAALAAAHPEVYARAAPRWFLAEMAQRGDAIVMLGAPGRVGAQRLSLRAFTTHRGPVELFAEWGSTTLGVAKAPSAHGGAWLSFEVPSGASPATPRALLLRDRSPEPAERPRHDTSPGRGWVWIDEVRVEGQARAFADGILRAWPLPEAGSLTLALAGEVGSEVTLYTALVGATGAAWGARAKSFALGEESRLLARVEAKDAPPGAQLLVATSARALAPRKAARTPHPLETAGEARYVLLAVPELRAPGEALVRHRRAQGLPAAMIDVRHVYQHYAHGAPRPEAIRRFVADLRAREDAPLEYLLLAGDAILDRTDLSANATIPAPVARTQYSGATPADRLYLAEGKAAKPGGPSVGRLPFRRAETMRAYVERLIAYETKAPASAERRLLRFVAGMSDMGPEIDPHLERAFRGIVGTAIPPAYDLEVTYADPRSEYYWPLRELSEKLVADINEGCLFLTFVGHGYVGGLLQEQAWDMTGRIFGLDAAERVSIEGTPPVFVVLACSTAAYDQLLGDSIGEVLLKQPRGPLAYWGASRVCHPSFNMLVGRELARAMGREDVERVGPLFDAARDAVIDPDEPLFRNLVLGLTKQATPETEGERLVAEGALLYHLLGDPALRIAKPQNDLALEARVAEDRLEVEVRAPLPDETRVRVSLEHPRARRHVAFEPLPDPHDPEVFETLRARHGAVNDRRIERGEVVIRDGRGRLAFPFGADRARLPWVLKAWAVAAGDVHQGAALVR